MNYTKYNAYYENLAYLNSSHILFLTPTLPQSVKRKTMKRP